MICFELATVSSLEHSHEKKLPDDLPSSSAKPTFADAMKHMGLRLPSKNESPYLQDVTGIRVRYIFYNFTYHYSILT